MLMMVIENPIQFTIVSAVPFERSGAYCATRVENMGESAITAILHVNRKAIKATTELLNNNNGETKQQKQDNDNAITAILFVPKRLEINPLKTQETLPATMIRNDSKDTLITVPG